MNCPHCGGAIELDAARRIFAKEAGSTITEKKSEAARRNGKLGGRPPANKANTHALTREKI